MTMGTKVMIVDDALIIRMMLRLVGSHHSPEETVFYLARKKV